MVVGRGGAAKAPHITTRASGYSSFTINAVTHLHRLAPTLPLLILICACPRTGRATRAGRSARKLPYTTPHAPFRVERSKARATHYKYSCGQHLPLDGRNTWCAWIIRRWAVICTLWAAHQPRPSPRAVEARLATCLAHKCAGRAICALNPIGAYSVPFACQVINCMWKNS